MGMNGFQRSVTAMSVELSLSGTPALTAFGLTMPAHAGFAALELVTTLLVVLAAARVRVIPPVIASS